MEVRAFSPCIVIIGLLLVRASTVFANVIITPLIMACEVPFIACYSPSADVAE